MTKQTYCKAVFKMAPRNLNRIYHDTLYGFSIDDDNELFGRLILEINQAGLSWNTILNKQDNFRKAYDNFNIVKIAKYSEKDITRLLNDAGIIRNKLKITAVIHNANVVLGFRDEHYSFKNWLDYNHPLEKEEWVKLFKKFFKFTGGEITNEFLMSVGYLQGSHEKNCPIYKNIIETDPKWLDVN